MKTTILTIFLTLLTCSGHAKSTSIKVSKRNTVSEVLYSLGLNTRSAQDVCDNNRSITNSKCQINKSGTLNISYNDPNDLIIYRLRRRLARQLKAPALRSVAVTTDAAPQVDIPPKTMFDYRIIVVKQINNSPSLTLSLGQSQTDYSVRISGQDVFLEKRQQPVFGIGYSHPITDRYSIGAQVLSNSTYLLNLNVKFGGE